MIKDPIKATLNIHKLIMFNCNSQSLFSRFQTNILHFSRLLSLLPHNIFVVSSNSWKRNVLFPQKSCGFLCQYHTFHCWGDVGVSASPFSAALWRAVWTITHSLTHTHSLSLAHSHTHSFTHSLSLSLSLSLSESFHLNGIINVLFFWIVHCHATSATFNLACFLNGFFFSPLSSLFMPIPLLGAFCLPRRPHPAL